VNRPVGIRFPLAQLDAHFLRREVRDVDPNEFVDGIKSPSGKRVQYGHVETLAEADGLNFLCPKCYHANKGAVGTHRVTCWFEGCVPDDASPGPGRWTPEGSSLADLTFIPSEREKAVSVLLKGGCGWHGFIVGGCATVA
jgi:hypothetical protein